MELNPMQIALNAGMGVMGLSAMYLIKKYARRKRLQGLLLLSGKSTMCHKLSDTKTYFLDLDEWIKNNSPDIYEKFRTDDVQFVLNCFPLCVQYVEKIISQFKDKKLVLVSSHLEMLQQFGLKKVRAFFPEGELLEALPLDDEERRNLSIKKFECASKVKKYKVYNSFEELYKLLRDKYNLKQKLKF